jgi:O-antigen/teichoic acid export membrane protein/glycosyltransferase involved in cell wall biosynthesis
VGSVGIDSETFYVAPPRQKSFLKDVVLTFGGRLVALISTLGVSVLSARILGPHGRGDYFFVVTFAAVIAQFTNLGLHSSNTYYSAQNPSRTGDLAINSVWLSLLIGGIVSVLVISFVPTHHTSPGVWYAAALVPANLFFLLGCSLLIGSNRTSWFNFVQIGAYTGLLGVVVMAGWMHLSLTGFLAVTALAWGVSAIVVFAVLFPQIKTWRFQSKTFFSGVHYSTKAYLTCLLGLLVLRANVFLLKYWHGSESVGYFSIAAQMADALGTFPGVVSMLLFPRLIQDQKNSWDITKRSLRNIAAVMAVLCITAVFVAKPFILIVYGPTYLKAIPVLLWMLPGVFFLALTGIVSQYLSSKGFPFAQVAIWGVGLALMLGLASILVAKLALVGAALALSVDYILLFSMLFFLSSKIEKGHEERKTYVLSVYPLSTRVQEKMRSRFPEASFIALIELRRLSLIKLVKSVRSLPAERIVIPRQQDPAQLLLLRCTAALTPAREIVAMGADQETAAEVSRIGIPYLLFRVITASLSCIFAAIRAWRELSFLEKQALLESKSRESSGLFINANPWFGVEAGGSLGHISGVINGFEKNGIELEYCAVDKLSQLDSRVKQYILLSPSDFGLPYELNRFRFHYRSLRQLRTLLKDSDAGFIYQRLSLSNFAGVTLSREFGLPLVVEYNSSEVWASQNWGKRLTFSRLAVKAEEVCLRHAHVVVTVSEPLRRELLGRGVPAEKIICYPNCVDLEVFSPHAIPSAARQAVRERYGIPKHAIVVGFIGTFGQWHGVEVLAQAIREMAESSPQWLSEHCVHFLLIGDGQKMGVVRETLSAPRVAVCATLTGLVPQAEAPAYLMSCDALISPHVPNEDGSPFFGSPTKLFEYMALGKAIVASDLDQIGEILNNSLRVESDLCSAGPPVALGQLAVLTRPRDIGQLVAAIRFVVENEEWRKYLGENARAEVFSKYTWDIHVRRIIDRMSALNLIASPVQENPAEPFTTVSAGI